MPFAFFSRSSEDVEHEQLHSLVSHCWKRWWKNHDLLSLEQDKNFRKEIQRAQNAETAQGPEIGEATRRLMDFYERYLPNDNRSDWVESLLVALVIAMACRAFFLQPFKIPTGSMQPTLNGITVHALTPREKTWWYSYVASFVFGQKVIRVVAKSDGELKQWRPTQGTGSGLTFGRMNVFKTEGVKLEVGDEQYEIPIEPSAFYNDILGARGKGRQPLLKIGQTFKQGDVILECVRQTGDYLFVDRFTYNFCKPKRGDVFVFDTTGLEVSSPGEFYIKRITGVPGDTLQIHDPELWVNGHKAVEPGMVKVMAQEDGYRGYTTTLSGMIHLREGETFKCGEHQYFAMGDNSFNSADSRFWGPVPYKNIVGRGFFVHWPFTRHFGRIE